MQLCPCHRILVAVLLSLSLRANADSPAITQTSPNLRYYYPLDPRRGPEIIETDVCVYGGTSGGITAAIQAPRMGKRAVLIEFGTHIGGLTTGGLSATDGGTAAGGIAREFYSKVGQTGFKLSNQFLPL